MDMLKTEARAPIRRPSRRALQQARIEDGRRHLKNAGNRVGKSGRLVRSLSVDAVMNAVDTEGREVMSAAGEGYWNDQMRREFGDLSMAGLGHMTNRHGRVSERRTYRSEGGVPVITVAFREDPRKCAR